jgi:multisubunit Na+/H+ antiporter MnhB subunit
VRRAYGTSTRVLSAIIMLLGVTLIVLALANGGGALALGVVLGTLLALLGAGRLWLSRGGQR